MGVGAVFALAADLCVAESFVWRLLPGHLP